VGSTLALAHPLYYDRFVQLASTIFGTISGGIGRAGGWVTIEGGERVGISGFVELGTVGEDIANIGEEVVSGEDGAGVSGVDGDTERLEAVDKLEGKGIGKEINKGASP
jgi:hypothetical protein